MALYCVAILVVLALVCLAAVAVGNAAGDRSDEVLASTCKSAGGWLPTTSLVARMRNSRVHSRNG